MDLVELHGQMVSIESLTLDHAAGLMTAADTEEVFAWLPYPRPIDLDQARIWIENALADRRADRRLPFAILSVTNGLVIRSTSYWDFDAKNAHVEIGSTWLSRAHWQTGCNTEVKLLLTTHAFEALELERVMLGTDIRNERSQQVAAPRGCGRQARRFYGELLGLIEIEKPEALRARGGVWFRCGEQQLHVGVEDRFTASRKAHPALRAAEGQLDVLADRLQRRAKPSSGVPPCLMFVGFIRKTRGATESNC